MPQTEVAFVLVSLEFEEEIEMREQIVKWLFQAIVVGVGIELGKDVYHRIRGRKHKDDGDQTRRDVAAEEQAEGGETATASD